MARKARAQAELPVNPKPPAAPESGVVEKLDYEIHVLVHGESTYDNEKGFYAPGPSKLVCEANPPGERTVVAAPFAHPAFCPACRDGVAKLRKGARTACVLVRLPKS